MSLFGGTSFFGMSGGSRGRHKKRSLSSASNQREEETIEPGVAACESAPGTLKRRTAQSVSGKTFSRMFGGGSSLTPVKGGIRKFTK